VGALEDGAIGPQTLMAVKAAQPEKIINRMAVHRDSYYRSFRPSTSLGEGGYDETTRLENEQLTWVGLIPGPFFRQAAQSTFR